MLSVDDIDERIAFGAQPDLALAREAGFTHVVNLRGELDEDADAAALGMELLWIRWFDAWAYQAGLADDLARIVAFVGEALSREGTRVLIHCQAGVERSPLAAYALLRWRGLSDDEARDAVRRARPSATFSFIDGNRHAIERFLARG